MSQPSPEQQRAPLFEPNDQRLALAHAIGMVRVAGSVISERVPDESLPGLVEAAGAYEVAMTDWDVVTKELCRLTGTDLLGFQEHGLNTHQSWHVNAETVPGGDSQEPLTIPVATQVSLGFWTDSPTGVSRLSSVELKQYPLYQLPDGVLALRLRGVWIGNGFFEKHGVTRIKRENLHPQAFREFTESVVVDLAAQGRSEGVTGLAAAIAAQAVEQPVEAPLVEPRYGFQTPGKELTIVINKNPTDKEAVAALAVLLDPKHSKAITDLLELSIDDLMPMVRQGEDQTAGAAARLVLFLGRLTATREAVRDAVRMSVVRGFSRAFAKRLTGVREVIDFVAALNSMLAAATLVPPDCHPRWAKESPAPPALPAISGPAPSRKR